MEKTPCLVKIDRAFEEEGKNYPGTFESSEDRIRVTWTQPEEEKGQGDSKFILSYRVLEKVLKLTRRGGAETEMEFRSGEKTEGIMRTSHGDFDLQMETRELRFFHEEDDFEEETDGETYLVKKASLVYDLCFPNQDPMSNQMFFEIRIAKKEKNV